MPVIIVQGRPLRCFAAQARFLAGAASCQVRSGAGELVHDAAARAGEEGCRCGTFAGGAGNDQEDAAGSALVAAGRAAPGRTGCIDQLPEPFQVTVTVAARIAADTLHVPQPGLPYPRPRGMVSEPYRRGLRPVATGEAADQPRFQRPSLVVVFYLQIGEAELVGQLF